MNYYNELEPFAVEWLKNLIDAKLIPNGIVDSRSIIDVRPSDLSGFTQCHFFAGIGGWSYALQLAGWPEDRPVWTGSCPCQPFSQAGKRKGTADDRHLWPYFHRLIAECRPPVVFGEQVASKDGLAWLDLVQSDLEGTDYASAAFDICAAGIGAPHLRQRLWFVAERMGDPPGERLQDDRTSGQSARGEPGRSGADGTGGSLGYPPISGKWTLDREPGPGNESQKSDRGSGLPDPLADVVCAGLEERGSVPCNHGEEQQTAERGLRSTGPLGISNSNGFRTGSQTPSTARHRDPVDSTSGGPAGSCRPYDSSSPLAHADHHDRRANLQGWQAEERVVDRRIDPEPATPWDDCLYIECRDGKYRPISTEPLLFPLAAGISNRVGLLRGAGNAIVPQVAAEVIGAYMGCPT